MKVRTEHRVTASMILKAIVELMDNGEQKFSKKKIIDRVKYCLFEWGETHYIYWAEDDSCKMDLVANKQKEITEIFNRFWTVKNEKVLSEFFELGEIL